MLTVGVDNCRYSDKSNKRSTGAGGDNQTNDGCIAFRCAGSALSKKGETITNMLPLRLTSHSLIMGRGDLSVSVHHVTPPHCSEANFQVCPSLHI